MSKKSKYRKIVPVAVTAAMVASAITPAAAAYQDSSGQYKDAISFVTEAGIAAGIGNGYFGVSDTIKRGDAAVMIAKALGLDLSNVSASPFTDINDRVKPAVNALYHAGIIDGKTKTSFAPNDVITRVEMAKVLANAYGLKVVQGPNSFKDVNSNWAPYVNALVNSGIAKGKNSTEFGAVQSLTRGEFALFIYRGKDHMPTVKDTVAPVIQYTGEKTISIEFGATLTLPTVTATDDVDGTAEVTMEIKDRNGETVSEINTRRVGTYTVTYNAVDLAGNKAEPLVITVVVNSFIGFPLPPTPPKEDSDFELSIMHFNDTHAHLDNAAKRVTAVNEFRAEKPDALLLDAGDVFSGTLYFNEFKGQADLEFMNLMKVDAMTFGNHEFDLGSTPEGHKALADFIKAAQFPFVSSNVDFSKDELFTGLFNTKITSTPDDGNIYTGIVKEVNGEMVGIFGLTTADTKDISSPEAIEFSDYIEEAKKMVAEFEKMGINKIVAITHIGFDDDPSVDNDLELAKAVQGIDIIVGGHSHTTLSEPVLVNEKDSQPTIIVQTGQYADNLGTLNVKFDKNGLVTEYDGKLVKIGDKAEDPEAKKILEKYSTVIEDLKKEETGAVAINALENPRNQGVYSVRSHETPLGNLITDGMLAKAKAYAPDVIMAMQNGGGIRAAIDKGPITVGEVIEVLPFGNTLATMKLTGAEIKEAFETSVGRYPTENGGFLHVSGAKVEFDSSKPAGERVVSVKYNSGDDVYVELEDDKTYTIATNAFTAKGGDGYDVFKNAYEDGRVIDLGLSDWENLREHVASLGDVDPQIEGRIVDVDGVEKEDFELSIMHFNDTHAHLDNAAKRVTAVKEFRKVKPDALLLDAGDVFSGTLYFNKFQGQADLEFMNLMKVDAMTFGNHEFDLGDTPEGHKALAEFIEAAHFPFVSSNVDFSKDALFTGLFNTKISSTPDNGNIYTGIVKEVNGEKVGIFGLTTADTKDIASPGAITFSDYIEEAKKMVAEFEKLGINKIVAITHIGYDDDPSVDNDIELAKAVEGIDIIVGGHSHTTLSEPDLVNGTIIVQTGQYADNLGTLNVKFDKNGLVTEFDGKLVKIGDFAEDPEAKTILEKYSSVIDDLKKEETGAIAIHALENPRKQGVYSVRSHETPLGNLITDGMLEKAKRFAPDVIMAMQNGGGIRAAIDQGPITVGEVIEVLPFGNTLATMKLTGAEIKEAFEISVGRYPTENGGFLHVSGAKVQFDSSKLAGERVVSVKYHAGDNVYVELEDNKTYTIATNAFTAKGGDGYDVFKNAYEEGRVIDLGLSDWENLREHVVSLGDVDPKIEGRIVDVAGELPAGDYDGEDFSGTVDAPKVYNGDVKVEISDVLTLGNAVVRGNLTLIGTAADAFTFSNIKVEGDLILTELDGTIFNFDGIEVDGDTIID